MVELIVIVVVGTSIWVAFDAPKQGLSWTWALGYLALWIVAFPWYLLERRKATHPAPEMSVEHDRIEVSPVGLGLALVGALAMLIAVFLPRVESTSFGGVAENTLIQSGDGWIFIGLSIGVAGAAYRAYRQGTKTIAVIVLGVIAIGLAVYEGTDEELLTLYPVGPGGDVDFLAQGEKASPAAGIYLAGIGGLLAAVGGFQMRSGPAQREGLAGPEATKICPDCAETVLAAARVCRYCGHRFEPAASQSPSAAVRGGRRCAVAVAL
jgi:hypothetical protein